MSSTIVSVLYIVATPIGNLNDITLRGIEILKTCSLIVAEDTRHCKVLLNQYQIKTPVISLNQSKEAEQTETVLQHLRAGSSVSLISDAGTPLISDPGFHLVQKARAEGIQVIPIPGPCAAIAALSVAGLPTDRFVFEGFLPVKSVARLKHLATLASDSRTLVFYEAPHRILETCKDMQKVFGGMRKIVVAREMTKMFETIKAGSLDEICDWVGSDPNQQRGEIVLIVAGVDQAIDSDENPSIEILSILLKELPLNQAVKIACDITGKKRNALYKLALGLMNDD